MRSPRRVLFVDDEADVRMLGRLTLRRHGFTVTEARNGLEAVAAVASDRFDVIVLDQRMPELTGLDAAARIRSGGYDGPILLFSGYLDDEARTRAAALGAATLDKADIGQLAAVVVGLLGPTGSTG